jgi:ArsR family transcriptional regulator, arsenate/arsenite/antimonite-responsive transcriptional repressor
MIFVYAYYIRVHEYDIRKPLTVPPLPLLSTSMVDESPDVTAIDALFKGIGDPTRIRLLNMLVPGELCVCDLVALTGLPQPTVSRHLAYLRRAGLIEATRGWKFVHYRLSAPKDAVHTALLAVVDHAFAAVESLAAERRVAADAAEARAQTPC